MTTLTQKNSGFVGDAARTRSVTPFTAASGYGVILFALSFPPDPELIGVVFALFFAFLHAIAFYSSYRSGAVLTSLFVAIFALAHGATLGEGVQVGLARSGLHVEPDSVRLAVVMDCAFVLTTTLVSLVAQRRSRAVPPIPGPHQRSFIAAFLAVFAAVAAAAFASGAWTSWSGNTHGAQPASGGIRLELLYAPMLFAASGLGVYYVVSTPARHRWRPLRIVAALALGVLLFALQSRRIMFTCGIVVALVLLLAPPTRHAVRTRAATITRVAVLSLVLLFGVVASAGWRMAASRGEVGLVSGLTSSISTVLDPTDFDASTVEDRMTYLWMDSMTIEARERGGLELDPVAEFESNVLIALPSLIYTNKWQTDPISCEVAYSSRGIDIDLPCTPTTEGYAAGGPVGVLLTALLWGLFIALCDWLIRRSSHEGRMVGLLLFTPIGGIEVGLFPMIQGARGALIVLAMVMALSVLFRLLGRYARFNGARARRGHLGPVRRGAVTQRDATVRSRS